MRKKRGRFDIVAVFESGGWIRATSDKSRSISAQELVTTLREQLRMIEAGIKAEKAAQKKKAKGVSPSHD